MQHFKEFKEELSNALALVSSPIQGVLAYIRLCKQRNCIFGSKSCSDWNLVKDLDIAGSVSRKITLFASSKSDTEQRSLIVECSDQLLTGGPSQLCVGTSEGAKASPLLGQKRRSEAIFMETGDDGGVKSKIKKSDDDYEPQKTVSPYQDHDGSSSNVYRGNETDTNNGKDCKGDSSTPLLFRPYSECSMWEAQQDFYKKRGAKAWEQGEVPSLISSNAFVANMYVESIVQIANNHWQQLEEGRSDGVQRSSYTSLDGSDSDNNGSISSNNNKNRSPGTTDNNRSNSNKMGSADKKLRVAVVEVGAGHGLLSFLMARRFSELTTTILSSVGQSAHGYSTENKSDDANHSSNIDSNDISSSNSASIESTSYNDFVSHFDVTVVGTDFHSSIFQDLLLLPWVRRLCEDGLLDFAVCSSFNSCDSAPACSAPAERGESKRSGGLDLLYAGYPSDQQEWDILVVVANYAFDSFPVDLVASVAATTRSDRGTETGQRVFEIGIGVEHSEHDPISDRISERKKRQPFMARLIDPAGNKRVSKKVVDMVSSSAAGVYVIPVAGIEILSRLKNAFPVTLPPLAPHPAMFGTSLVDSSVKPVKDHIDTSGSTSARIGMGAVAMIVGDCIIAEDDDQWQSGEFEQLAAVDSVDSESSLLYIPWFDPPLISPTPSVCAVPVSPRALDFAFSQVFSPYPSDPHNGNDVTKYLLQKEDDGETKDEDGRGDKNKNTRSRNRSSLRSCTPLCGSSFSVLTYSNSPHLDGRPCKEQAKQKSSNSAAFGNNPLQQHTHQLPAVQDNLPNPFDPPIYPHFGPHDFITLREFILCDYTPRQKQPKLIQISNEQGSLQLTDVSANVKLDQKVNRVGRRAPLLQADGLSLEFLRVFIMELGCRDPLLFVELRWVLLRKITNLARPATLAGTSVPPLVSEDKVVFKAGHHSQQKQSKIRSNLGPLEGLKRQSSLIDEVWKWCDVALTCVRKHSCCSLAGFLVLRAQTAHWLLALSSMLMKQLNEDCRGCQNYICQTTSSIESGDGDRDIEGQDRGRGSENMPILKMASIYALQSCLSLFSGLELALGLGAEGYQWASFSFYHSTSVPHSLLCSPSPYFGVRKEAKDEEEIQTKNGDGAALGGCDKKDRVEGQSGCCMSFLHCVSREEAVHCAMALTALSGMVPSRSMTESERGVERYDLRSPALALPLLQHLVSVTWRNKGVEGSRMRTNAQTKEMKLLRKAEKLLGRLANKSL